MPGAIAKACAKPTATASIIVSVVNDRARRPSRSLNVRMPAVTNMKTATAAGAPNRDSKKSLKSTPKTTAGSVPMMIPQASRLSASANRPFGRLFQGPCTARLRKKPRITAIQSRQK